MTVLGVDISKWNGNWDAGRAKAAGAVFSFIKASQATFTDPKFIENWRKAKDAGILRGAYHYLDYTKPAREQANYFANLLETDPGELPLVVDYEEKRTDNNYALARTYLSEFLSQLQDRNVKPMIYISRGFWNTYGDSTTYWLQFPLWLANWTVTEAPPVPAPWNKWFFWQFTADGPGSTFGTESARVDMNQFYGSLEDLKHFSASYAPTIALDKSLPSPEERMATLETLLSNLEPVFTEAYAKLEKRVTSLENGSGIGSTDNPVDGYEQRITTIEQSISAFSQHNASIGNQITSITQQLNGINQKVASFSNLDPNLITGLENRILVMEKRIAAEQPPVQPPVQPSVPPSTETYAVCNVRGLNVRSGPGLNYPVITGLTYSQRVKVLERQNGWAHLENPAGWCAEVYLSFS